MNQQSGNTQPPKQIGSYRLLEEIGRGGMAVVYRARDMRDNKLVAIKILPLVFTHDPTNN